MIVKTLRIYFWTFIVLLVSIILLTGFIMPSSKSKPPYKFPYAQAGLSNEQAAAHLLSRFTYGALPGQVDEVAKAGLENWFQQQLAADLPDDELNGLLNKYDALKLSNAEIVNTYQKNGQVLRRAIADGVIDRDSAKVDKNGYKSQLRDYMAKKGIRPERELVRQFVSQKIWRTVYSNNQLQEVLTEFWFNHFNVSFTKNSCSQFIPAYERDVIRPNVLSRFEDLLIATAKSPAMLLYLDNFSSMYAKKEQIKKNQGQNKKFGGINENYAREVMELHTLGVDGGYTQADVTEAARILTGWTVYPMGNNRIGNNYKKIVESVGEDKLRARGFVHEGDFLFTPNRHDTGEKTVLGKHFKSGGGYEEGVRLLKMLAGHPSAAEFISTKIAIRFVSDEPPKGLIDKMVKTFREKNGDIKQVLITMVSSPEFWNETALRSKTKSPIELAISGIRALNAEVSEPYQLFNWIKRMGQQLYFYQAPTGFPDRAPYWINTGSLLNRMNFGLALADKRIPGITFDLLALNKNHEPESAEDALITYSKILMDERNLDETIKRLTPFLNDPTLYQKVSEAAGRMEKSATMEMGSSKAVMDSLSNDSDIIEKEERVPQKETYRLSQVIGILLGSPEFQRR
ncbi:MAG TPA: DUF1800 domain-containing protein [Chryseolinea sp.]|nr:DUF1800 domain-containing protein [Chryseolinea sp.]